MSKEDFLKIFQTLKFICSWKEYGSVVPALEPAFDFDINVRRRRIA